MKLNNQSKNELRKMIFEKLKEVPWGQRINLDKDLLEDLLFEVVTLNKEKGIKVKLPIWSGDFLKKLDLSEIDFTDVSWCILDRNKDYTYKIDFADIDITNQNTNDTIDRIRGEVIEDKLGLANGFIVNYNGTNANIALTKSFEAIYGGYIEFRECDFTGIDFSHQDLSGIKELYLNNSSINKTKLSIPKEISLQGYKSFFEEIDLSTRTINASEYFLGDTYALSYCDLRNTGINIHLEVESIKGKGWEKKLQELMKDDWIGCYVNGKKVLPYKEKRANASAKKEEYEQMKDNIFSSVLRSIDEQVSHIKR